MGGGSTPVKEQKKKDLLKIKYFNCRTFGHYASQCLLEKRKGKQHASTVNIHEHLPKKKTKQSKLHEIVDEIQKEYLFLSTLSRTIAYGSDIWLVDNGSSRHMTGSHNCLSYLVERESTLRVELGDNTKYAMRGVGATSFQLDFGDTIHIQDVLYVTGL
jgi:hypothetical protein